MKTPSITLMLILSSALAFQSAAPLFANQKEREEDALKTGIEAYIYGYPLVLMDATKQVSTHTSAPNYLQAPINQFAHASKFPTTNFKEIVSPNVDTLYSMAWLDLTDEPIVLHVPDTHDRYYLMPMLDAWTNVFASPGKRTTGTKEGNFAILGPNWKGTLPEEVIEIRSPTNTVWIIGRTQCSGTEEDYAIVNAIQKQYTLTPLSAFDTDFRPQAKVAVDPKVNTKIPPAQVVANMDISTFFNKLTALMKTNPPTVHDDKMVKKLAQLGVIPGRKFDINKLNLDIARGLTRAVKLAQEKINSEIKQHGNTVNGWALNVSKEMGNFGTNYNLRAAVSAFGLGANRPEDAVYPYTTIDNQGKQLNGAHRYKLHFDKDEIPPVHAFWSLTMYNNEHYFVPNSINRYSISSQKNIIYNKDGSLDIYMQNDPPEDKRTNWLPAPKNDFNVILRMYWPNQDVLEGIWQPPVVIQLD